MSERNATCHRTPWPSPAASEAREVDFASLVEAEQARLHRIAARLLRDEDEARDLVQTDPADILGERINQLGGKPDLNPAGLLTRSATEYAEGADLRSIIEEDLVAERIAIETYRAMIRYFSNHDPTTRQLIETILAKEEEHAQDMHDLLVQQRRG